MLQTLIHSEANIFNYDGSLTSPACSQGVNWWIISTPIIIARKDMDFSRDKQRGIALSNDGLTARPVQGLNERKVNAFQCH